MIERREQWLSLQPHLDVRQLKFLDETGFQNSMRDDMGWAPLGETPLIIAPTRGKNVTLLGVIDSDGPVVCAVQDGYMNKENFLTYLSEVIGPALQPGDLLVMDNLRAHTSKEASEILASFGVTPLFLPPYSPEFNPIELCWAWLKSRFRSLPLLISVSDVMRRVRALWERLPDEVCRGATGHCGYTLEST